MEDREQINILHLSILSLFMNLFHIIYSGNVFLLSIAFDNENVKLETRVETK